MERQEHKIICFQIMPKYIIIWVVLVVLLHSVSGWASCNSTWVTVVTGSFCACDGADYTPRPSTNSQYQDAIASLPSNCAAGSYVCASSRQCAATGYTRTCCSDECELKHFQCDVQGGVWDEANCKCNTCDCGEYQQRCESVNGIFEGNCANVDPSGGQCCVGVCYICNTSATQTMQEFAKKVCCDQGLVPPKISDYCLDQPPSGKCGMVFSNVRSDFDSQWKCREITDDPAMMAWYRESCLSSSSGGSSSSAGGSSSSAGGSSSSGDDGSSSSGNYPSDCPECPWLDSILDTLTAQKHIVNNINNCLMNPSICFPLQSATSVQIDSSIVQAFRPYLDSLEKLSEQNNHILSHMDTGQQNILEQVMKMAKNDTALMQLLTGNFSNVENGLSSVDSRLSVINSSIHLLNDSIREYADSVSRSIGISADSLIAHIDSVKSVIPSDILDSILKYQKLSAEDTGSVVLGDLPVIDSLIDTTVKYWKRVIELDSLRHLKISDSLGSLHEAIDGLAWRMSTILGYGDTASKSLRNDIEGIENAINEYRDSALKYYASFGDSMGALNGSLGVLVGQFTPGTVDSGNVGFANTWVFEGERMSDSILRAIGWLGGLDTVDVDSVFAAGVGDSAGLDSIENYVNDSLAGLADSLNGVIVAQNDSIKRGLPDSLDVWSDSLIVYSPFASFDSLIFGQLGAKIPNSNECPEDCSKWSINLPRFGLFNFTVDYGLCLGRLPFGGMNALGFVRLLLRLITVWSCIWIVFNGLTRRKD